MGYRRHGSGMPQATGERWFGAPAWFAARVI